MSQIFVLVEHRQGALRDITLEMLSKGRQLAQNSGAGLTAVLLGNNADAFVVELAPRADRVLVMQSERLKDFNAEIYQDVLAPLLTEQRPLLTLIGHTSFGMDLAPALATQLSLPLATDCIDLKLADGKLTAIRQMYGGKVNAEVYFPGALPYLATVRPGSFAIEEKTPTTAEVKSLSFNVEDVEYKRFVRYIEAAVGEVDITQAEVLVSVGQGIADAKNIPLVAELAQVMGATLSCSRPIVDKKWLPKERQVGTSGKTVKPKVYLAIGISGAFQHLAGIKGGTLIAINKDPKAPIFRVADYGIVGDLFKIVPVLKDKVKELKGAR